MFTVVAIEIWGICNYVALYINSDTELFPADGSIVYILSEKLQNHLHVFCKKL